MAENKRDICSDFLKILACFFVIMNHTSTTFVHFQGELSGSWLLSVVLFYVSKMAVPIFLMTSGMFLLGKERDYAYSWKKGLHFTVILLVWNYVYWLDKVGMESFWRLDKYLYSTISQASSIHLWYLYTLIGFYLLLPFISKLVMQFTKKDFEIFLLIWVIFGTIIPFLNSNFGFPKPFFYFQIGLFTGFLGYFILGAYLKKYPLNRKTGIGLFIFGLSIAFILQVVLSQRFGHVYMQLDNVIQFPIVCLSTGFYSVMRTLNFEKLSVERGAKWITSISSLTLGIYLIHVFVIRRLSFHPLLQPFLNQQGILGLLAYLVFDVLIFGIALLLTKILNIIPIVKKIVS